MSPFLTHPSDLDGTKRLMDCRGRRVAPFGVATRPVVALVSLGIRTDSGSLLKQIASNARFQNRRLVWSVSEGLSAAIDL